MLLGSSCRRRRARRPLAVTALLLAAPALGGCSGDGDPAADAGTSTSPTPTITVTTSPSPTPYLPVPAGVDLTEEGTSLEVGDSAVVAWEPTQKLVGVIQVKVTSLERTSFKQSFQGWKITGEITMTQPYFVRATVKNVGDTDLSGQTVPLYAVDGDNTLVQASPFASDFEPCPSTPFGKKFVPGERASVCLVYLVPDRGDLSAVSFRPSQEFNPITWSGKVESYEPGRAGPTKGAAKGSTKGSKKGSKKGKGSA